jgi:hypothetical protein
MGSTSGTSTVMPGWAEEKRLGGRCEVRAACLSALLKPEEIRAARLIKIDAEGAEWHVILGMASVLESGRRDLEVILEATHRLLEAEGLTYGDLLSFFRQRGFFPYRVENDYSAASYIARGPAKRPQRIEAIGTDIEQVDVIFSRTDAASL